MSWNEDDVHAWLARRPRPACLRGSWQHDAAVLRASHASTVACTDQVVEGVHVDADERPARVGAKAVLRCLSDLAACGARAKAVLLALRASQERSRAWIERAITGASTAAEEHGAELVGGDLASAPGPYSLAVTAIGELPTRGRPPGRDRARAGQVVLATGPVGGSLLGRHLRPVPRLEAGRGLREAGATALIDVSDGFARDLGRVARASRVAIELEHVPIHRDAARAARASGRTPLEHALEDGEDHELLACLPAARAEALLARGLAGAPEVCRVGRVRRLRAGEQPGLWSALEPERDPVPLHDLGGYVHGGTRRSRRRAR